MKRINYVLILIISIMGCRKPYNPPASSSPVSYLVVEGVINPGNDSTDIKLSKTVTLNSQTINNPVLGATVTVEGELSGIYPLSDINKNGHYKSGGGLNLPSTQRYHLKVKTNNSEYLSDFESIKLTPPIDSVGFIVQNNGIQLYLNTRDPNNNTHYYRWQYVETWNFRALYQSFYVTDGTQLNFRKPSQQVYSCFQSDSSSTVLLGSSAKLASDVIYQSPLTKVASTSEKIETKYSILVSQYALTPDAYNFWQILKTNTEQLGTIFSVMPSGLTGNIHCITNPSEPVLGYISIGNVQQKRIFITSAQLPYSWNPVYPYNCEIDTIQLKNAASVIQLGSTELVLEPYMAPNSQTILGYLGANQYCADCTLRGTTTQPAFWK